MCLFHAYKLMYCYTLIEFLSCNEIGRNLDSKQRMHVKVCAVKKSIPLKFELKSCS